MAHLKIGSLKDDPEFKKRPPKKMCVKTEKIFGEEMARASGFFFKGRLHGEAEIQTENLRFLVNFNKGVPHGRIR